MAQSHDTTHQPAPTRQPADHATDHPAPTPPARPEQESVPPPGDPSPSQAEADQILQGAYGMDKEAIEKRERENKERDVKPAAGQTRYTTR